MMKANTYKLNRLTTVKSLLIRYINTFGFDEKWTKFSSSCQQKYLIESNGYEQTVKANEYRNHFEIYNNNKKENPVTISTFSIPIMIHCHFSFQDQRERAFERVEIKIRIFDANLRLLLWLHIVVYRHMKHFQHPIVWKLEKVFFSLNVQCSLHFR